MWNLKASCKEISELDAINEHFIHRKKLLAIKPRIDNKPPKNMPHVHYKAKKELEELKTQAEIQHKNQLLLKKLQKIEQHPLKTENFSKQSSGFIHRLRDQLIRISDENEKILSRIQTAKPHYPVRKQEHDYLHKKYLVTQLSENARRRPRNMSYNPQEMMDFIGVRNAKTSRPNTAAGASRGIRSQRPMSAKEIKVNL